MKNYTPVLVNTSKAKFSFKTFFLGSSAAKSYYYCGRHKTEDIYILWIEATRFGNSLCFPCVLDEQGDAMVYLPGRGLQSRNKNTAMIQRWNLFVQPATFAQDFDVGELTPEDFHAEYGQYKGKAMGELLGDDDEDGEDGDTQAIEGGQAEDAALPEHPEPSGDEGAEEAGESDTAQTESTEAE